ncbi:MAG: hypothetical protein QIT36_gp029 [Methanophagales virus GBV301]|uniref:Uncharacterized protein n=1 Tax=Methanophagales virus GBV301 TaxID=2999280 RepID=A0A9E8VG06_9CAUD|nr:MAG: hypothetical protein QIT36_gp029 [Methanophagales virus GBV301]WAE39453.1 MAG: hypothetical protein LDLAKGPJ_00029 [Methanophagales virus GBV301]
MGRLILLIPHKCPLCSEEHDRLECYTSHIGEYDYLEPGDTILLNEDIKLGFIEAEGECEKYQRTYLCKVGIRNNRLTSIVQSITPKTEGYIGDENFRN